MVSSDFVRWESVLFQLIVIVTEKHPVIVIVIVIVIVTERQ